MKTGERKFCELHGSKAKSEGKTAESNCECLYPAPTEVELEGAYLAKLEANPYIKRLLTESTLPFAHYYMMWGKKVNADKYLWTVEIWEKIRTELQSKALLNFAQDL